MALDRAKTKANVDKFLRANRIQDAIRELQKLAEDNPRDIQTLNQIGNLYLRIGNKAAAVPMFIKVADLFAKDGFHMKAVASLKIATREDPDNLQAWEMLGSLSEQQGFTKEARLAYDQVARLVTASGNLDALVRIQRKILDLEPENIKIRVQVGDNLLKMGQAAEGAKEYLKAAQQLVRQGLFKEAARLFERAAELGPENLRLLESLLRKMFAGQQHEQALEILAALLERHPESETLVLLQVDALSEMRRTEEAEALCLKLLAEKPDAAAVQSRLVRLLVGARRFEETFGLLRKWAQTCDPGRLGETEAMVREVLAHDPGNLEGLRAVVDVARRSGERQRLLEALSRLATAAEEKRNAAVAVEAVEEMVAVDPANPLYRERLERLKAGAPPPRPARAAAPPPPPPPPPPPEKPAAEETGELEIEIEVEDLQLGAAEVTASLPSGSRVAPSPEPEVPALAEAPGLPEAAEAEAPRPPSGEKKLDPREAEAIKEQLTEAEVFLKYGFADKAIAELNAVLKRVPDHVHAHQKLISIYRKQKKTDKAVRQILKLAQVFADQGDLETRDNLVEEARALDPNSPALKAFLEPERPAPKARELDLELLLPAVPPEAPPPLEEEVEIALDEGEAASLEAEPPVEPMAEGEEAAGEGGPPVLAPPQEPLAPEGAVLAEGPGEEALPVLEEGATDLLRVEITEGEARAQAALADKLEEAEFYLSQELFGEARRALEELEAAWPEDPRVRDFRRRLEAAGQAPLRPFEGEGEAAPSQVEAGPAPVFLEEEAPPAAEVPPAASPEELFEPAPEPVSERPAEVEEEPADLLSLEEAPPAAPVPPPPPSPPPRSRTKLKVSLEELLPAEVLERDQKAFAAKKPKDEFLELANELGAALDGLQSQEEELFEEPAKSPEEMSFAEVFEEFKKGVEKKVGEEDFATHYNLGIAYKEMELLDEAIGEFQLAARSPQFFVECCSMLGLCFRQKGLHELAEKWYRKGLEAPGFPEEVMAGLRYDLAETLEDLGRKEEALALFREVYAVNARYRDVKAKIQQLA